jgi:hypothetical protein
MHRNLGMRTFWLLIGAVFCALLASSEPISASQGSAQRMLWHWSTRCGEPTMTLEVQLDSQIIHREAIAVCQEIPAYRGVGESDVRIAFTFRPKRAITWQGYRDNSDRTASNAVLEVNLWHAGGEVATLLIGVSVMGPDRILMNTIHTVHPGRRDETNIARGLVVRTYPIARQKTANGPASVTVDVKGRKAGKKP